jgi:transcriptional regulator with XRE-family HTH domain
MTQEQLGEHFKVSKAAVAMWESGKNTPDHRKMSELISYLGLHPALAITPDAESEMPLPNASEAPHAPPLPDRHDMIKDVPVFGTVSGGDAEAVGDFELNGEIVDLVRRPPRFLGRKDLFAAYVQGYSVSPWREPGQLIYLEAARPPKVMDYVLVELKPTSPGDDTRPALVKRLLGSTPTKLKLRQYNPAKDFEIDLRRVLKIYRVLDWDELMGV